MRVHKHAGRYLSLNCRRALGHKRRHAFLLILRRKRGMEHPTLKAHAFRQAHFKRAVHAFLDHHADRHRLAGNQRGDFQRFFQQFIGRHDTRHDPATLGFHRIDKAPGQAHFHGLGLAHRAGQALGAAHARQHAEVDFRLAELGAVARQDEVAHQRQLTAAAQGEAVDGRDDRLATVGHAIGSR